MLRCRQEIKCSLPQMSWFSSSVAQRALEKLSQLDLERKRVDTGVMNDYHQSTNTNTRASSCLQACVLENIFRAHLDLKVFQTRYHFGPDAEAENVLKPQHLIVYWQRARNEKENPFKKWVLIVAIFSSRMHKPWSQLTLRVLI